METIKKKVDIYTDGACSGNPGPGGWGVLLIWEEHQKEIWGSASDTTNNRMELMAAIQGLEILKQSANVQIFMDSTYVKNGITQWIQGWKKNGWKTSNKKAVKNEDLWKRLDMALVGHQIKWNWVRGHAGNIHNERADKLAKKGIKK